MMIQNSRCWPVAAARWPRDFELRMYTYYIKPQLFAFMKWNARPVVHKVEVEGPSGSLPAPPPPPPQKNAAEALKAKVAVPSGVPVPPPPKGDAAEAFKGLKKRENRSARRRRWRR